MIVYDWNSSLNKTILASETYTFPTLADALVLDELFIFRDQGYNYLMFYDRSIDFASKLFY